MKFFPEFDSDVLWCGQVDLPWAQVAADMQQAQHLTGVSIVDSPLSYQDSLATEQNQFAQYGWSKHNTQIWKSTNPDTKIEFNWEQTLLDQLPVTHGIAALTRQDVGQVLPWHQDKFYMHRRLYPDVDLPIWRFLVFMEPWQMGHVLQVGNSIVHGWQRGEVVVWKPGTWHVSANIGNTTKWTCNVTGFVQTPRV